MDLWQKVMIPFGLAAIAFGIWASNALLVTGGGVLIALNLLGIRKKQKRIKRSTFRKFTKVWWLAITPIAIAYTTIASWIEGQPIPVIILAGLLTLAALIFLLWLFEKNGIDEDDPGEQGISRL